ncbi:nucleotidyltransferase family protein [Fictibacillus iocasae]|uniref:Nucleotidyltransferase family protein n=1 Tax=Fictibacillus iocasae TaxID=2715437 RepID=A0ABW2NN53_9BACL
MKKVLKNEQDVITLILRDDDMMKIIKAASSLNLPDWWICAGFVRSKIWDTLHGYPRKTEIPDVDVIYFDNTMIDENLEKQFEKKLTRILPNVPWSVKNEARMHLTNNLPPYTSSEDAISKFPETATALGVTLDKQRNVILTAPCGLEDVLQLIVRPTPFFRATKELYDLYEERIVKKNWTAIWPKVRVCHLVNNG